jgi:parvulin-like peptidyl-prolyl isomerase
MIVGFVGSMMWPGCSSDRQGNGANPAQAAGQAVATVGNYAVTTTMVDNVLNQQMGQFIDQLPASVLLNYRGSVLQQLVAQGQQAELAKSQGINPSDDEVANTVIKQIRERLTPEAVKQQLTMSGKLKPNATQKEVDEAFKLATGKTLPEYVAAQEQEVRDTLKDESRRENLRAAVLGQLLVEKVRTGISVTDEELKKGYDSYEFKKVFVNTAVAGTKTPLDKAKEILAEIKGGLKFETAIDRYSGDPPEPKKKLSEKTNSMQYATMSQNPQYKALTTLKPGDVSEPIVEPVGVAIYKLIGIKSTLPKDFDKRKEEIRKSYSEQLAQQKITEMLQTNAPPVKWNDKGYEALYNYSRLQNDFKISAEEKEAKTQEILKVVQNLGSDDRSGIGAMLAFNIFNGLFEPASNEKKKALADQGIEIYNQFFQRNEDPNARLKLVDMYVLKGDTASAIQTLTTAATNNQFVVDARGQGVHESITAKIKELLDKKIVTADQLKPVLDLQNEWKKNKLAEDKRIADANKEAEDAAKKARESLTTGSTAGGTSAATAGATGTTAGATGTTAGVPKGTTSGAPGKGK